MTSSTSTQSVRFETTDYERAGEYLTDVYGTTIRMTGRRVGYSFVFTQLVTPTYSVGTAGQTNDMSYDVDSPASLYVLRPRGTVVDYRSPETDQHIGPSELFLASAGADGSPYRVRWTNGAIEATALPFPLLNRVAGVQDDEQPVRFTDLRPHSRAAARQLAATIDHLIEGMRDRPETMATPLVASTSGQLLCAAVLTAYPNTVLLDPTIEDRHDSHPRTLRRAIAYIDDHAHEDINVTDIAAAVHVTVRALQHAFRRHRATTPMGYVRLVRLRQAHLDLLAADPTSGVTVTEVAARWGFFHPGRFARYYREIYGVSPYQTLLRDAP